MIGQFSAGLSWAKLLYLYSEVFKYMRLAPCIKIWAVKYDTLSWTKNPLFCRFLYVLIAVLWRVVVVETSLAKRHPISDALCRLADFVPHRDGCDVWRLTRRLWRLTCYGCDVWRDGCDVCRSTYDGLGTSDFKNFFVVSYLMLNNVKILCSTQLPFVSFH